MKSFYRQTRNQTILLQEYYQYFLVTWDLGDWSVMTFKLRFKRPTSWTEQKKIWCVICFTVRVDVFCFLVQTAPLCDHKHIFVTKHLIASNSAPPCSRGGVSARCDITVGVWPEVSREQNCVCPIRASVQTAVGLVWKQKSQVDTKTVNVA